MAVNDEEFTEMLTIVSRLVTAMDKLTQRQELLLADLEKHTKLNTELVKRIIELECKIWNIERK